MNRTNYVEGKEKLSERSDTYIGKNMIIELKEIQRERESNNGSSFHTK